MKRSDIQMYGQAMRQRWPISDQNRGDIITALMQVVNNPTSSERDKTSAARALMSAEAMNQSDEQAAALEWRDTILEFATRRGITIEADGGADTGGTGSGAGKIAERSDTQEREEG